MQGYSTYLFSSSIPAKEKWEWLAGLVFLSEAVHYDLLDVSL
jgi:hypothetical protein